VFVIFVPGERHSGLEEDLDGGALLRPDQRVLQLLSLAVVGNLVDVVDMLRVSLDYRVLLKVLGEVGAGGGETGLKHVEHNLEDGPGAKDAPVTAKNLEWVED
jgi:hypothetical protein